MPDCGVRLVTSNKKVDKIGYHHFLPTFRNGVRHRSWRCHCDHDFDFDHLLGMIGLYMQDVTKISSGDPRRLTVVEFQQLAAVPSAVEWFANLDNPRTRRA